MGIFEGFEEIFLIQVGSNPFYERTEPNRGLTIPTLITQPLLIPVDIATHLSLFNLRVAADGTAYIEKVVAFANKLLKVAGNQMGILQVNM
jgi:hypothetical protein